MTPKLWEWGWQIGETGAALYFYLWKRFQSEKHTCCTEIISNHHLQTACHKSICFTADLQKMYSITVSRHDGMVNPEAVLWCCKAKSIFVSIFVQLQDSIAEKSKIIKVDKVAKGEAAWQATLHLLFVTLCFLLLLSPSRSLSVRPFWHAKQSYAATLYADYGACVRWSAHTCYGHGSTMDRFSQGHDRSCAWHALASVLSPT